MKREKREGGHTGDTLHELAGLVGDDPQSVNFRNKQNWWLICESIYFSINFLNMV
jgi:hypothetical protein